MDRFKIGDKQVGEGHAVFIIAEAGVNHAGSFKEASEMVEVASLSKVDAVTFQHISYDEINSKYYSPINNGWDQWRLNNDQLKELFDKAHRLGLTTTACVVDFGSLEFVVNAGADFLKVVSGDITCHPFLIECAKTGLPIFLSTGSALISEIESALEVIEKAGGKKVVVYQTNSQYPTPPEEVNLKAMELLKQYRYPVGFCDHTKGTAISLAAVAMGAKVIEKHFSLDSTIKRPDYEVSINPDELIKFVSDIRNIESALGHPIKQRYKGDDQFILVRRSCVARNDLAAGSIITWNCVAYKRPGTGIPPSEAHKLIDKKLKYNVRKDEHLYEDMLEGPS